jgi:uncharacterized protein
MPKSMRLAPKLKTNNRKAKLVNCPICSSALTAQHYAGQTVDICGSCRGLWCDSGELSAVVNALISANKVPDANSSFLAAPRQHEDPDPQAKACPRCRQTTDSFNFAYDSNIFLNRCNACDGVWLDGGEIRSVAQFIKKTLRS